MYDKSDEAKKEVVKRLCGCTLVGWLSKQTKQSNANSGTTATTMINHGENQVMTLNPIFRSESFGYYYPEQSYFMMEKRQLFLRSYQFCRKKSVAERIKGSLVRVKKIVWLRLRSARRLRKLVFSRFKCGFYYRRRRFFRLFNGYHYRKSNSSSSCFL